jgi:hypothetical protein
VALVAVCGLLTYALYLDGPDFSQWSWWRSDNVIELPGIAPPEPPALADEPSRPAASASTDAPVARELPQHEGAAVEAPEEDHPVALSSDGRGLDLIVNNSAVSIRPGRTVISEEDARAVRSQSMKTGKPAPPVPDPSVSMRAQTSTRQLNAAALEESTAERPASPASSEETTIRRVLTDFQVAYNALDASGTKRLWPNVDAGALDRVFQSLASQHLELVNCQIAVNGAAANATCNGHARIVPRDKNKGTRVESRLWVFNLAKSIDRWDVNGLNVR